MQCKPDVNPPPACATSRLRPANQFCRYQFAMASFLGRQKANLLRVIGNLGCRPVSQWFVKNADSIVTTNSDESDINFSIYAATGRPSHTGLGWLLCRSVWLSATLKRFNGMLTSRESACRFCRQSWFHLCVADVCTSHLPQLSSRSVKYFKAEKREYHWPSCLSPLCVWQLKFHFGFWNDCLIWLTVQSVAESSWVLII